MLFCDVEGSTAPAERLDPVDAGKAEYYFSDPEWAKRWPWEELRRARKR